MIQFFIVFLQDVTNNESIVFSSFDGSATPIVILDDGWSPNVTKYIRDGEKTWSDVVEELECMTNVATRDEALALIEKLNALIHRAARDIEEKQSYTVRFVVRSQFSNAPNSAFTNVLSPPDDGTVITLSTDIQTAPPGQIKFKLRFKRTGAWITTFNDITHSFEMLSETYGYKGVWTELTSLPTSIQQPTPVSLSINHVSNGNEDSEVEKLFLCVNSRTIGSYKYFSIPPSLNMSVITYPSWRLAQGDFGYLILDNTDSDSKRPYTSPILAPGTYAVFASWRSVQSNISHRLQVQFDNNTETRNVLLFSSDTKPNLTYVGTVTMAVEAKTMYLQTTIGHSTGYELEKIILVGLKPTSVIIELTDFLFKKNLPLIIENTSTKPVKSVRTEGIFADTLLLTYDSIDMVTDNQSFIVSAIGHSPDVFSLRTKDYYHVYKFNATVKYRPIRITFH